MDALPGIALAIVLFGSAFAFGFFVIPRIVDWQSERAVEKRRKKVAKTVKGFDLKAGGNFQSYYYSSTYQTHATPPAPLSQRTASTGIVDVRYGVYNMPTPVTSGTTVQQLYNLYASPWSIPTDAVAYHGRNRLKPTDVLPVDASRIDFHRKMGSTPLTDCFTPVTRGTSVQYNSLTATWHDPNAMPSQLGGNHWRGNLETNPEPEEVIGDLLAVREFKVSILEHRGEHHDKIALTSVHHEFIFHRGINIAKCDSRTGCKVPEFSHSCGFYTKKDPRDFGYRGNGTVMGLVRLSGKVLNGSKGYRSHKLEIMALIPYGNIYPNAIRQLGKTYGVPILPNVEYRTVDEIKEVMEMFTLPSGSDNG